MESVQELLIRTGNADDALQLRDLSRSTFYETFAAANTPQNLTMYMQKSFSIQRITSELTDPTNTFFIVLLDDIMAGYAKLRPGKAVKQFPDRKTIELERIYVAKKYHGRKIGSLLIERCIQHALALQCGILRLGVWEHNTNAIGFYEGLGFSMSGSQPFMLGEDKQTDLVMIKDLA